MRKLVRLVVMIENVLSLMQNEINIEYKIRGGGGVKKAKDTY